MPDKLRSAGFVFAVVFVLGAVATGGVPALQGADLAKAFAHPYVFICLGMAALFLLSALVKPLRFIQPVLFFTGSFFVLFEPGGSRNIYGLGFFIIAILLLERGGFFERHRPVKVAGTALLLITLEVISALREKVDPVEALFPTFFIAAFALFLWFLYKDRLVVYLAEPKAKLSLTEKGLSNAERAYVAEAARGKQQKEVAESTVRNTLARAYHKLGVEDKAGLAVLAEKYELVE